MAVQCCKTKSIADLLRCRDNRWALLCLVGVVLQPYWPHKTLAVLSVCAHGLGRSFRSCCLCIPILALKHMFAMDWCSFHFVSVILIGSICATNVATYPKPLCRFTAVLSVEKGDGWYCQR